ncbi:MAG TPA: 30S ribosomal protein S3 [Patescibacteria group bacterium]
MGQKVNPIGFRMGHQYTWSSQWFANKKQYKDLFFEDFEIRKFLKGRLKNAGVAKIEIARSVDKRIIKLHVSRPGIVIGRGGSGMEEIKKGLLKLLNLKDQGKLEVRVEEVRTPDLDAQLVASQMADQISKRLPVRRIMRQAIERVMRAGAKGVRVTVAGRLGGSDIARRETLKTGTIPLHTLRADIDFAKVDSQTKSGIIGVKVWICKEKGK